MSSPEQQSLLNEQALDENEFRTYEPEMPMSFNRSQVVEQRQGKRPQGLLLFFHFAFKLIATLIYLLSGMIGVNFITTFVFVLILLSMDFWLVKNLSGRLLAGMRWWSIYNEENNQMQWKFEAWSTEERQVAVKSQVSLFWVGLIGQQIFWSVLLLAALFRLKLGWFVITAIACSLNGSNVIGYLRCKMARNNQAGFLSRFSDLVRGFFQVSGGAYSRGTTTM